LQEKRTILERARYLAINPFASPKPASVAFIVQLSKQFRYAEQFWISLQFSTQARRSVQSSSAKDTLNDSANRAAISAINPIFVEFFIFIPYIFYVSYDLIVFEDIPI